MKDKFADFKDLMPDYVKTETDFEQYKLRHTAEHVFNQAIEELFPGKITRAIGPAIEEGYYNDSRWEVKLTEDDFEKIEAKMQEIIDLDLPIVKQQIDFDEAKELFKDNPFKQELIAELEDEGDSLTIYHTGDPEQGGSRFVDLCKGPHLDSTGGIKAHKVLKIAGAYWRGDEKNEMLTRVYGIAFDDPKKLEAYLWQQEEAKKRDHRKLGKQLDLFTFSEMVGPGLPLFTPRGALLRELLNEFSQKLRLDKGFQRVWVPHITKPDLYKTSGHWDKFGHELFLVKSQETDSQMVIKPMNCPHHQQIFASRPRSYKELPIKYLETTAIYRDEKIGELLGLSRVRSVTQDDSHTFCTPEQINEVYTTLIEITKAFYDSLGMSYRARLSFRDPNAPEKYLGDDQLWEKAQKILLEIAKTNHLDYYEAEGEAAFYGPKIDFMIKDSLGREWQLGTPQLDFVQPERFGLKYTDMDGVDKTPVMIHFALMGSLERFLSVYIEHTEGKFPAWLAPEQVRIIPISDDNLIYADKLNNEMLASGIRSTIDSESERMQNKIRKAQEFKIPYMLIVGKREETEETVSVRYLDGQEDKGMKFTSFVNNLINKITNKDIDYELR